ncbi:MAG TPA: methyltransferase domain-containing protein [Gemmatimonadaceae bacterium]|nr:methyltransferase domain-containing protein [Gemmatimonadaceae bacterium]
MMKSDVLADLTRLPWADDTFDVLMCNHVLEHIPDDLRAMDELFRVLRPGGWGLVLVPFSPSRPTSEDPTVTAPEDRQRLFGQADHVRRYGREYTDRLWKAGFDVSYGIYASSLGDGLAAYYGLDEAEYLIAIRKPIDQMPALPPKLEWRSGHPHDERDALGGTDAGAG